jgi:hypothetical protein
MTRLLLVFAMLVSLWPIGLIAATAATDSSTTDESTSQTTTDSTSKADSSPPADTTTTDEDPQGSQASPPDPDYAAYKALHQRTNKLLKQLDASNSLHGVADAQLARRARTLAADYRDWDASNGELDSKLHRLAIAERRIAQRVAVFAAAPTQARLDHFNAAITQYNSTVRAVQG